MGLINKFFGTILLYITYIVSFILDIIIGIIGFAVAIVKTIARGFSLLMSFGGCLLIFIFAGPYGFYILFNPITILVILFFVIFPILGTKFVSHLKYIKYMITEYLFDLAGHLKEGKDRTFYSFFEYVHKYKKAEEDQERSEQRARQEQQQRAWEERFKQWQEFENSQQRGGYSNFGGYGQNTYNGGVRSNPNEDFKKKYEESCDLLGVDYNADVYQIKLAYRKKAKSYHPDVNKSMDSTEMFQKINNAYEFLSENNINYYKKIS